MSAPRQRAIGSILGLAIGDALGAPFGSRRAMDIPDPIPAFELPWRGRPPGAWTDGTAMARNLWCSLIEHGGELVLADVLDRHLVWLAAEPPGVDNQTRAALAEAARGTLEPARAVYERRGPEVSAGNGSVRSCAPLGTVRANDPGRLYTEAPALSQLTHWDERCRTACLAVTLTTAALIRGVAPRDAVIGSVAACEGLAGAEELEYLVDHAGRERPVDGPEKGFALFAAGIGLQVVGEERGFEEGMRAVTALGGDTAANGAVAGALLGAHQGDGAIPRAWRDRLADGDAIASEAGALADRSLLP